MIPRELPSYLKVAYSLRYADEPNEGNFFNRICNIVQRIFALIKEIIYYQPSYLNFEANKGKLQRDFKVINQTISDSQKPLCVYFVRAHDHNGAILGTPAYYYHHYKIKGLQEHFAVAPQVASSPDEMKNFMSSVRQKYADREIKFVDVVSHGGRSNLAGQPSITAEQLQEDLFSDCAHDATILLDACSTGLGSRNIADEIARNTPGRKILAPGRSMFFSKPVIQVIENDPRVVSAVHGFAIFNAYECNSFSYLTKMPTQYSFAKDEALLLRVLNAENVGDTGEEIVNIYNQLSQEIKDKIVKKICEKENHPVDVNDNFGETFLLQHPLHFSIRLAFRLIFNELTCEYSAAKSPTCIQNTLQAIQKCFSSIIGF